MKNKVKILREQKNLTQTELAEKSGLSLRTVQRVESGSPLKGFTLNAIAKTLGLEPQHLFLDTEENAAVDRAKLINLSALSGLIVPYGGVIFPLILIYRTKDPKNKELGKGILGVQIVLATVLSILMIASPFVQHAFSIKFPLFLIFLIAFLCVKLLVILKNGITLNQKHELSIKLKINFL
ncbi:helix-turn-helix domain-containing protein [Flavobacterium sp. MAH-1]|uniref:Helix-turn-helix domain-containing protein n=1 Tax=Flavobacterium agri TaxID=2743471 RepID=A0A7Y8Y526_9FLAO|nr:helix-turn-helix domain-containing protein [Flavobacterium agri]NUY81411.1 helix-turn-helix domain-containing protein [Flavobacterium agri]NYA71435.1 helix-turn-helix domain-containing protein [Flavobacterium agri]